jgi:hypothetical protein
MTRSLFVLALLLFNFSKLIALTDIRVLPEYHYLTVKEQVCSTKSNTTGWRVESATSTEGGGYLTASYSQTAEELPVGFTTQSAGIGQLIKMSAQWTLAVHTAYRRFTLYLPNTEEAEEEALPSSIKQRFAGPSYGVDSYYQFKNALCLFLRAGMIQNKGSKEEEKGVFNNYAPFGHIELQSYSLNPLKFSIGGGYERLLKQREYIIFRYTAFLSLSLLF